MKPPLPMVLLVPIVYLMASLICFLAYDIDKKAAKAKTWRISEKTLLMLGVIGGWPGGFVAQRVLRHKCRKQSFLELFWVSVALNLIAVALLLAWDGGLIKLR